MVDKTVSPTVDEMVDSRDSLMVETTVAYSVAYSAL